MSEVAFNTTNYASSDIRFPSNVTSLINGANISDSSDWKYIDVIAYNIETYYLWVILVLGFPGNISSLIVISRLSPGKFITLYVGLLAIIDNVSILVKLLMFVLPDHDISIGQFGCKFLGFLGNYSITFANWVLVLISIERYSAVHHPFKFGRIWTLKTSVALACGTALVLLVVFLHLFWTVDYQSETVIGVGYCLIHEGHLHFMMNIWYWVNIIIYAILPCFLLVIFNVLIVTKLKKTNIFSQLDNRNGFVKNNISAEKNKQITVMLVSSAICLVLLTLPRSVMLIMAPYQNSPIRTRQSAIWYLVDTLAYVMCDSNHAINFYIYSFSARRFREEFFTTIRCQRMTQMVDDKLWSTNTRTSRSNSRSSLQSSFNNGPFRQKDRRKIYEKCATKLHELEHKNNCTVN